ncbi:MAG: polysaccharide biosynthesis protein, partial [Clostridia bacterium]|nr:polysaccharide biosynthesis protein [Clostridia bacterium]
MKISKRKIKDIAIIALSDFISMSAAFVFAYLIVDSTIEPSLSLLWIYLANIVTVFFFFALFRLYFFVFTSVGIVDVLKTIGATAMVLVMNVAYYFIFNFAENWRIMLIYALLLAFFALVVRFSKRFYITVKYSINRKTQGKVRAMIVGAGSAGAMLIREIQTTDKIDYLPVCIIDDDEDKLGKRIGNVKVVGATKDIPLFASQYGVHEIIIAMPAAAKTDVKRIYNICNKTRCKVKILPGIYQIVSGEASVSSLREVRISDLLGREQVTVDLEEIIGYIENQVVLVTGGGGSIGSELCRQIASHNPKQLIILDIYENNAYDIEQELKRKHPELNLLA